jgi:hypothetical protein
MYSSHLGTDFPRTIEASGVGEDHIVDRLE